VNSYVNKLRPGAALAAVSALLAGCSGGANGIPPISSTNPISTGALGFAVGTANLYGTNVGLNVVSTYRKAGGLSNVLVDTPTITGPFTLPKASAAGSEEFSNGQTDAYSTLPGGPSVEEVAAKGTITGTSQSVHPGTPVCDQLTPCIDSGVSVAPNTSTFGQAGGVFVNGISPGNDTNQNTPTIGQAESYVPYTEPMYDSTPNTFVDFGGPPTFDPDGTGLGLRDGLNSLGAGVLGIPEGITTFANVVASAGTYTLSVAVPTGVSSYGTVTATANLGSTAVLGTITAPTLTLDGKGGGTFTVAALPAGVTEELVQIVDFGPLNGMGQSLGVSCQGPIGAAEGAGPVYYTILVKSPGRYTLADTIGPNTTVTQGKSVITPSPSICTGKQNTAAAGTATPGDSYSVQAIGADYPLYESLYPVNTSQTPTLVGAKGQADITISLSSGNLTSAMKSRLRSRVPSSLIRRI
jgi:hypothetical protein